MQLNPVPASAGFPSQRSLEITMPVSPSHTDTQPHRHTDTQTHRHTEVGSRMKGSPPKGTRTPKMTFEQNPVLAGQSRRLRRFKVGWSLKGGLTEWLHLVPPLHPNTRARLRHSTRMKYCWLKGKPSGCGSEKWYQNGTLVNGTKD